MGLRMTGSQEMPRADLSSEHEERFREANALARRGGSQAPVCGARTRTGAPCFQPPIREGKGRCLRHAGPKAANEHRASQKRDFEAGRISAEVWNRAEARRAANRLGRLWKKDPWVSGSTIDLGPHEGPFQDALGNVDRAGLPPAVLDWLRWRYRRTQIDRQDDTGWHKALRQDLPRRVTAAGPCPAGGLSEAACGRSGASKPRTWTVGGAGGAEAHSRRALPDRPRAPKVQRGKGYGRRGRPRTQPADEDEYADLMGVYRENAAMLKPIMDAIESEQKQLAVLRTLRAVLARPNDVQARQHWLAVVEATLGR